MSKYNETILTNAGFDLASRAANGRATFEITRAAATADDLSKLTDDEQQKLTKLPNEVRNGEITNLTSSNDEGTVGTEILFTNEILDKSYSINAVGLYAKEADKDEVLYALVTAKTPEFMPDFADKVIFQFRLTIYVVVGEADNITVNINPQGTATKEYVDNQDEKISTSAVAEAKKYTDDKYVSGIADANKYTNAEVEKANKHTDDQMKLTVQSATLNGTPVTKTGTQLAIEVPPQDLSSYAKTADVDTKISTSTGQSKKYADELIRQIINSAPENMNTLSELADAVASNKNVADAIQASITNKAEKVELETNYFKAKKLTQAEYDALTTKDAKTAYYIVG